MNQKNKFFIVVFAVFALSSCDKADAIQQKFSLFKEMFADAYPHGFVFKDGWYQLVVSSAGFGETNAWNPDGFVARCCAKLHFASEAQEAMSGKTNDGFLTATSLQAHFEEFEMHFISSFVSKEHFNSTTPAYSTKIVSIDTYYDNNSFYYRYCQYIEDADGRLQFDGSKSYGGTSVRCDDPNTPIIAYPLYHSDEWRSEGESGRFRYDILTSSSLKTIYYSASAEDNYSMQYLLQPDGCLREIECTYGRTVLGTTTVTTTTMRSMEEMKVEVPRLPDVDITGARVYGLGLNRMSLNFGYYLSDTETTGKEGALF